MVTNVSTVVAIPILARTMERVNSSQVTPEGTHAAAALNITEISANYSITATLTPAEMTDHVQIIQGAHKNTHAAVGMATMEINASIEMHVSHPLAETRELALEAITATHAVVDQASLELKKKKKLDG